MTSLPFDFFAGLARRIVAPRAQARHGLAPLPLTTLETVLYATLVSGLFAATLGVTFHHRAFVRGRVAVEDAERRNAPEFMGELICEQDRIIGVSIQQVFDVARVERVGAPRPLAIDNRALDGALAAAAGGPPIVDDVTEVRPVALARAGTWHPRSRR